MRRIAIEFPTVDRQSFHGPGDLLQVRLATALDFIRRQRINSICCDNAQPPFVCFSAKRADASGNVQNSLAFKGPNVESEEADVFFERPAEEDDAIQIKTLLHMLAIHQKRSSKFQAPSSKL